MEIGLNCGTSSAQNLNVSAISSSDGSGGNTYVPRAMYSLRMSFWIVPLSTARGIPRSSATTMYIASSTAAVALMVIDVETLSSGRSASSRCRSSTVSIATPTRPTSPSERGESESSPICVGRSNAVERPVCPAASNSLNRVLVSCADPKPAYWRIVQSRPRYIDGCTPRVNGNSPGAPSFDASTVTGG